MLHVYHPNKNITGSACSFWLSRDGALMATIIKQTGWDSANDNGTFLDALKDPTKKVNIKLSAIEGCAILDCVERNRPFSSFHDNDETPKSIQFTPWMSKTDVPEQRGFSFSINVTNKQDSAQKNGFYIGLTYAEARLIREFIITYLHKFFENPYSKRAAQQVNEPAAPLVPLPVDVAETVEKALTQQAAKDPLTGF
jgi:hypothetical protein